MYGSFISPPPPPPAGAYPLTPPPHPEHVKNSVDYHSARFNAVYEYQNYGLYISSRMGI